MNPQVFNGWYDNNGAHIRTYSQVQNWDACQKHQHPLGGTAA